MLLCFLCGRGSGVVKEFDPVKFEKARRMAIFRKAMKHKHHDLDFPTTISDTGYHSDCYGKFVILKAIYKQDFERILRSEGVSIITDILMILFITI